jgi:hypothetical protein
MGVAHGAPGIMTGDRKFGSPICRDSRSEAAHGRSSAGSPTSWGGLSAAEAAAAVSVLGATVTLAMLPAITRN